jgi:hypothetical protein
MPISAEWDNREHTIVRIQVTDPWTIEEYTQAGTRSWDLIETVNHPVHLIIDFTHAYSFPKNLLASAPTTHSQIHPRQALVVGVRISPYLQAVMKAAIRVFPRLGHNLFF